MDIGKIFFMKKRNIFFIIICILLVGSAFLVLRFRRSQVIKPSVATDFVTSNVVCYRQDDDAWAEETLGDSKYTMKSSGCLVTCIASSLSMENLIEITPDALNLKFSADGIYDAEGNIQWDKLREKEGLQVDVCQDISAEILEKYLQNGKYPIVRVRMNGFGSFHYVLVVGNQNGTFLCMDPFQDQIVPLSHYWNRVYAIRCVYGRMN